jgi:hypothetical protein
VSDSGREHVRAISLKVAVVVGRKEVAIPNRWMACMLTHALCLDGV